jgi:hypothetical protein
MRRRLLTITVALAFAGAGLGAAGCSAQTRQRDGAFVRVSAAAEDAPERQRGKVYEGRIKDVRPAIGVLILTVGEGKEAREVLLNMSEARIVGPSGNEWKGQDLWVGDRVRVEMTRDGRLVQQISVLPDKGR